MSAPLVLIVGRYIDEAVGVRGPAFGTGRQYSHAVERAGAVPLIMPPLPELTDRIAGVIRRVDALVLHGGGDVDPRRYGAEPTAQQLYGIRSEHDEVEFAVVRAALAADLPMLAICRGLQVVNVALGGTLHQHIGDDHWFRFHPVQLQPGSLAAAAIGSSTAAACHCVHHQAVDQLGDGLVATGHTADGVIHVAERPGSRWLVAPQWHPEDSAADDEQQQRLFGELVAQC